MTPDNALQKAIYERLRAYEPLTAALGGMKVYDHVPAKLAAPYVVIGNDTLNDLSTKNENGWDCTITIHAWDFYAAGRKSVKTFLGHIYDALHRQEANITLAGFTLAEMRFDGGQATFQESASEGESDHYYHGVTRFRALITD
jgi:hypothetical protein